MATPDWVMMAGWADEGDDGGGDGGNFAADLPALRQCRSHTRFARRVCLDWGWSPAPLAPV